VALDASDTGTGKTYVALEVMRRLGLSPVIIAPKSVLSAWRGLVEQFGITPKSITNIEKLKMGKSGLLLRMSPSGRQKRTQWAWALTPNDVVIWDECHQASGEKSDNSRVMAALRFTGCRVLGLSATVADSPLKLRALGFLMKLHQYKDFYSWAMRSGCYPNLWGGIEFPRSDRRLPHLKKLHDTIFPRYGVRMRISDIPEFPETSIQADAYDLGSRPTEEIEAIYAEMDDELRNPDASESPLTCLLRARQKVELLKVPLLIELVEEALEEGKSVVVFISFRETLAKLEEGIPDCVKIYGGQPSIERDLSIAHFQSDSKRVCLCMIQAGGLGVSLHDLKGDHPRVSLLTPPYSAVELKQALGRVHRAGGKSKSIQRIVFAAGTVEDKACVAVRRKLINIGTINDGTLMEGTAWTTHDNRNKEAVAVDKG